jgi:hypothetical protein
MTTTRQSFNFDGRPFHFDLSVNWDAQNMSYTAKVWQGDEYIGSISGGCARGEVSIGDWNETNIGGLAVEDAMNAIMNERGISWS